VIGIYFALLYAITAFLAGQMEEFVGWIENIGYNANLTDLISFLTEFKEDINKE
jgi:hypothetical protein